MAYGLKYQSNFYNRLGSLVSIELYKDGYSDSITDIRIQSVSLEWGLEDFDHPIAGTIVNMVIANDTEIFNPFEDLLKAYPKDFKCIIKYNGEIVFEGFNIVELNEITLLKYNTIAIKFVDYLSMLQYDYLTELEEMSSQSRILTLIQEGLINTGLIRDLYINSTLFERNTEESDSENVYTCFYHTYSENCVFYKDPFTYQNTYVVLSEILKSFSAFLYSFGNKWVIERYEDIGRDGDWVVYDLESSDLLHGEFASNLKQEYNKQNDNFHYLEARQKLNYKPGVQKIKIELNEKELTTLVFNEFEDNPPTTDQQWPTSLSPRKWYVHEDIPLFESGTQLGEIDIYCKWNSGAGTQYSRGIFYHFILSTNDHYGVKADNSLSVEFKFTSERRTASGGIGFGSVDVVGIPVFLYLNIRSGYYVKLDEDGTISLQTNPCWVTGSIGEEFVIDDENPQNVLTFSKTFHFADVYETLGDVDEIPIIIGIHTPYWQTEEPVDSGYLSVVYVGDFSVRFDSEYEDNEIEAYIDKNYYNTEEVSLTLYDLPNWNFASGFFRQWGSLFANMEKSEEWYSENYDVSSPSRLIDNFLYNRYRRSAGSRSILNALISIDEYLKPFSIITDNNIQEQGEESSGGITKFIIMKYVWDLVNGTYDIEAEEYSDTDITIINV